jgi:fructose-bisphosphate aldolase class I
MSEVDQCHGLEEIAQRMVASGKGILAIDESSATCNKRFEKLGIPTTTEARRAYRELLLTAPEVESFVSGAILYEETIRQTTAAGRTFVEVMNERGIIPGIKLDTGLVSLANTNDEKVTKGLDDLPERAATFREIGARFAKWRAVFTVTNELPSERAIHANAHALARYAIVAQAAGLVPIVEPEVLMDGDHSLQRSYDVHERVLHSVFGELALFGVRLEGMVLKPSMVVAGSQASVQPSVDEVAQATVDVLMRCVPAAVAGIAFLSGGQSDEQSTAALSEINRRARNAPWPMTFSFGRALQNRALGLWKGEAAAVSDAQAALAFRSRCNSAATRGEYTSAMESSGVAAGSAR